MVDLKYDLRDDGVLYYLDDGTVVQVQGNSARRATVVLQKEDSIVPPETGNLSGSSFREKLTKLASDRFGDVNRLADDLGYIAVGFKGHLQERDNAAGEYDAQTNVPELQGTPYRLSEEGFIRAKHTQTGEIPVPLTNFTAKVEEEVVRDDGAEEKRIYKIAGWMGEKPLPTIDVSISQFNSMNWVSEQWGLETHIYAGQHNFAKEAIELYSRGAVKRFRYAHTGWRVLEDGTRVYLHSKGAVS